MQKEGEVIVIIMVYLTVFKSFSNTSLRAELHARGSSDQAALHPRRLPGLDYIMETLS